MHHGRVPARGWLHLAKSLALCRPHSYPTVFSLLSNAATVQMFAISSAESLSAAA
jgi:hypothetical protein